jgi:hypothetical protein
MTSIEFGCGQYCIVISGLRYVKEVICVIKTADEISLVMADKVMLMTRS